MAGRRVIGSALALVVHLCIPQWAGADAGPLCDGTSARVEGPRLRITSGSEPQRAWLVAEYQGLKIRKFTSKSGASVIELRHADDVVVLSMAKEGSTVSRNGESHRLNGESQAVQTLLGGSSAMYRTRAMLSQLERTSALSAIEMSALSAAAMATFLTGDVDAPLRLADRFVERHRGILRRVAFDPGATCWSGYSDEAVASWNDYTNCVDEAGQGSLWLVAVREQACAVTWLLRVESAWFEYLKCLSPLGIIPKVE